MDENRKHVNERFKSSYKGEYRTTMRSYGYVYLPKSFTSYAIDIMDGRISLYFKNRSNLWEFEKVEAKNILGILANSPRKFHDDMFKLEHKLHRELSERIRIQSCPK